MPAYGMVSHYMPGHLGAFNLPDRSGGNPVAISQVVLIDGFLSD
jgi:hypothetical protein